MKYFSKLFFVSVLMLASTMLYAQDKADIKVKVSGTVQAMVGTAQSDADTSQFGTGIRRARMKMSTSFSSKAKAFLQIETTSPKLLDARIEYTFNSMFKVRVGRFIGAGVRAGGLTSHTVIDIVERPVSAQMWGKKTIGADYRDYGFAFLGSVSGLSYNLTFHNGSGATNVKESHKSIGKLALSGMAVSGMVAYKPAALKGLEVGGYYGMGNAMYNDYTSYSAHAYYQPGPFRLKAEYIAVVDQNAATDVTSAGYYVFGGYKVMPNVELVARYEQYDANADVDKDELVDITLGATYAFFADSWKAAKVTVAYVLQNEDESIKRDDNVLYAMFQLAF